MMVAMDERKKRILKAIIHEHILTAEPVGSRTLAKTYQFGVSSATIRNEMSDLEDLGYLEQPHTSAGRIPSDKGYRFYVDSLKAEGFQLDLNFQEMLKEINAEREGIQSIMAQMAKMLSKITRYTSVISEPQIQEAKIKQLQLLPVDKFRILIVLIADTGLVHNKIVKLKKEYTFKQLNYLNQYLQDELVNKKLSQINSDYLQKLELQLLSRWKVSHGFFELINQSLTKLFCTADFKVYLGGTSYILEQPEFNDLENLKKVLNILDQEEKLRKLLENLDNAELQVVIGHENKLKEMHKCSIVFATYSIAGRPSGKIAVIGPTRMEYPRVISTVNSVANILSQLISQLSG